MEKDFIYEDGKFQFLLENNHKHNNNNVISLIASFIYLFVQFSILCVCVWNLKNISYKSFKIFFIIRHFGNIATSKKAPSYIFMLFNLFHSFPSKNNRK